MSSFTVPPGDPDSLRRVARSVSTLSGTVGETRADRLKKLGGQAQGALPAARVAAFSGAQSDAAKATGAVGLSLVTVSGALADWADALDAAQESVRGASHDHQQAETLWRRARSMGESDLQDQYHQDMVSASTTADRARDTLDGARRQVVSTLRGEVDVWVPDQSSLTPVKAWQRAAVGSAPANLSLDLDQLAAAYRNPDVQLAKATATHAIKGGMKGYQVYSVLNYLRAPSLAASAEKEFLDARGAYQALKGAAPDLSDPAVYKQYMKLERDALKTFITRSETLPGDVSRAQWLYKSSRGLLGEARAVSNAGRAFPGLSTAEIVGEAGKFDKLLRPVRAAMPFASKVLGPLGVVAGGYDVYTGITEDGLAGDDRAARITGGLATATGGALATGIAFGLVAATPVGLTVIAAAGVVAVGCWAYENREAIADGAKKVAGAVGGFAKDVGSGVADGAKKVWKGLFG